MLSGFFVRDFVCDAVSVETVCARGTELEAYAPPAAHPQTWCSGEQGRAGGDVGLTVNGTTAQRPTEEEDSNMAQERKGRGRGFASMDPEKQREIASKGGRAAHVQGTAHEWTSDEAREAGRKGGAASRGSRNGDERE
jgi:general stress protein YciG